MSKGLYTTTDQLNYIMNCNSKDHVAIWRTIDANKSTSQVCGSTKDMIEADNPNLVAIGAITPGSYIRGKIYGN